MGLGRTTRYQEYVQGETLFLMAGRQEHSRNSVTDDTQPQAQAIVGDRFQLLLPPSTALSHYVPSTGEHRSLSQQELVFLCCDSAWLTDPGPQCDIPQGQHCAGWER